MIILRSLGESDELTIVDSDGALDLGTQHHCMLFCKFNNRSRDCFGLNEEEILYLSYTINWKCVSRV